ncbi:MAG: hypothetical protein VCE91_16995, partial [Nitrospinota bacterium]
NYEIREKLSCITPNMQDGVIAQKILILRQYQNGLSFQISENPSPSVEMYGYSQKKFVGH